MGQRTHRQERQAEPRPKTVEGLDLLRMVAKDELEGIGRLRKDLALL
jgi:hypothetical protein